MKDEQTINIEFDEDGNRICSQCKCHYKNIDHKCPEWMLLIIKHNKNI